MKTLHFYVVRQILATLLMTVAVFTFVLLVGNVLKEILGLLVNRQATLLAVVEAIGLLIPYVLAFALPMGMLTATLLVFGRLSADQELTAMRASGVSLVALVTPVLLLSVALSGVCALMNMQVSPQCRKAYKKLLFSMGLNTPGAFVPERTYIKAKDYPGLNRYAGSIFYIGKVDGTNLSDILIYELDGETVGSRIHASEGTLHVDRARNVARVILFDAWHIGLVEGRFRPVYVGELPLEDFPLEAAPEKRIRLTDMSILQLWDELRELEKRITLTAPVQKMSTEELREKVREVERQRRDMALPVMVQIHRQFAFSFACIGFTLVGIPLGIRAHRRETTFGIGAALLLVMVYYSFFIVAQAVETRPEWHPHLILWLPNFIFQAVGAVLLWRANRGI